MNSISAHSLTKHFAGDIRAVDGIDLAIDDGQIFGFLGANGSGKTTTVRMLTTLLRPTSGRAEACGLDVLRFAAEVRSRIGLAHDVAIMDAGKIVAEGAPATLKAGIGADVITVRIEGGADELARAEQAVRRLEGLEDVRTIDDSIIVYVRAGSAAIASIVLLLDEASLRAR